MPGNDLAKGGGPMPCLYWPIAAYGQPTRCPVLSERCPVLSARMERAVLSKEDLYVQGDVEAVQSASICLRAPYAMSGTDLVSRTLCDARY
eukprot:2935359-Rhodomonas_salina.2